MNYRRIIKRYYSVLRSHSHAPPINSRVNSRMHYPYFPIHPSVQQTHNIIISCKCEICPWLWLWNIMLRWILYVFLPLFLIDTISTRASVSSPSPLTITITINIAHRQRHPSFKTSLLFILGLFILLFTGTFFRYFLLFLLQYLFFVLFNYRMNERRWRLIKNFMCKSRFFCVIENQFSQLKIEIKLLSKFLCKIVVKPTDAPKGEGGGRGTGTGRRPIFCQIH